MAARLIEMGDKRYGGFVSRALAAQAAKPLGRLEDMAMIVKRLGRSEGPFSKPAAAGLLHELLKIDGFPPAYLKLMTNIEFDPFEGWVVPDSLPKHWETTLFIYLQALPKAYDHGPLWEALFDKPEREKDVAYALLDRQRGYSPALVKAVHEALETERDGWLKHLRQLDISASKTAVASGRSPSTFGEVKVAADRLAYKFETLVSADVKRRPATVDIALDVVGPSASLLIEKLEQTAKDPTLGYGYVHTYLKLAGLCGQPYLSFAGQIYEARVRARLRHRSWMADEVLAMISVRSISRIAEMLLPHTALLLQLFDKKKLDEFAMAALKKAFPGQESAAKKLVAKIMVQKPLSLETLETFLTVGHGEVSSESKEERRKAILDFHKELAKGHYMAARALANSDSLSEEPEFREVALAAVDRAESRRPEK